jgi:hypothetical protein
MYGEAEKRTTQNPVVGKSKDRRPLGRIKIRWEDNIIMGFKNNKLGNFGTDLVQDRDQ